MQAQIRAVKPITITNLVSRFGLISLLLIQMSLFTKMAYIQPQVQIKPISESRKDALPNLSVLNSFMTLGGNPTSVFYKFDTVASTSRTGSVGKYFTSLSPDVSINDTGNVAFVGNQGKGEGIFVGYKSSNLLINVNPNFTNNSSFIFTPSVQINNENRIVARERISGAPPATQIQVWDGNSQNTFTKIADAGGNILFPDFDTVFGAPSINNKGQVAFLAANGNQEYLVTPGLIGFHKLAIQSLQKPRIADNGKVLIKADINTRQQIRLYDYDLSNSELIKSINVNLGSNPGISDDGNIIAFIATDTAPYGPGLYISIHDGSSFQPPIKILGENWITNQCHSSELGYDANYEPLCFKDLDLDSKLSITHLDLDEPGIVGDSIVISFVGTPNNSSQILPGSTKPFLFSDQKGIWTIRVDMEKELSGSKIVPNIGSPIKVVQLGDNIDGNIIKDFAINDSLANVAKDDSDSYRTMRRGDHRVAFWATSDNGDLIIRGSHLDSDQDGLLDHWETDGIDVNSDGIPDLYLNAMGADPFKRDLFLQIDWLREKLDDGLNPYHSNEPAPGLIQSPKAAPPSPLIDMFNKAPTLSGGKYGTRADGKLPEDIPAGITLHIDGGFGVDAASLPFNYNMGIGTLRGGNEINHTDIVYFGKPGSVSSDGVETTSLDEIKKLYFLKEEYGARELAFHYAAFVDFVDFVYGNDAHGNLVPLIGSVQVAANRDTNGDGKLEGILNIANLVDFDPSKPPTNNNPSPIAIKDLKGNVVKISKGTGAGQIRIINDVMLPDTLILSDTWKIIPDNTSKFVVLAGSAGSGEEIIQQTPAFNSLPGNDLLVSLGAASANKGGVGVKGGWLATLFHHWEALAHELGHNFGLRHGGIDNEERKPAAQYKSIMSYTHQFSPTTTVNNYSGILGSDPTFDDWSNLKMDFQNNIAALGSSPNFAKKSSLEYEPLNDNFETALADLEGPQITINSPLIGEVINVNNPLTVTLTVTDNLVISLIKANFDKNGNSIIEDSAETISATNSGINTYSIIFNNLSGPSSDRTIYVYAIDSFANFSIVTRTVAFSNPSLQLQSITIAPVNLSLAISATQQFTATGNYSDNSIINLTQKVVWTSSDNDIATIDQLGKVRTLKPGIVTITATLANITGTIQLVVKPQLQSLSIIPSNLSLAPGENPPLTLTGTYSDGTNLNVTNIASWVTSAPTIVSVNSVGQVTALQPGTATITATIGSLNASTLVIVTAPLQTITVTPLNPSILTSSTQQFMAIGSYSDGLTQTLTTKASWRSDNLTIATVDQNGLVTALQPGIATIYASYASVNGNTSITVIAPPTLLQAIMISPTTALSLNPSDKQQFTLTGSYSDGSSKDLSGSATWSSSDATVALVDPNGVATALAPGTVTLTATFGGFNATTGLITVGSPPATSTIRWVGKGCGATCAWEIQANWDLNRVPGPNDTVIIDSTENITIVHAVNTDPGSTKSTIYSLQSQKPIVISNSTLSIEGTSLISNSLNLDGNATLTGKGVVTVLGPLNWNGGLMNGAGRTIAKGGLTVKGDFSPQLEERTLENYGSAIISGTNSFSSFRTILAVIVNQTGATFELPGNAGPSGSGATFYNLGTLRKSGTNDVVGMNLSFNNLGTVEVLTGTLNLTYGGNSSGSFNVAAGGKLSFGTGKFNFDSSSLINGPGAVIFSSSTSNFLGTYSLTGETTIYNGLVYFSGIKPTNMASLTIILGGQLLGTTDVTVNGLLTLDNATIAGAGKVSARGGMLITGGGGQLGARTLDNYGKAIIDSPNALSAIAIGATFNNLPDGIVQVQYSGGDTRFWSPGALTFNNQGTLIKTAGSGNLIMGGLFNNSGTVDVQSGRLQLFGNGISSGQFSGGPGTALEFDYNYNLSAGSSVTFPDIFFSIGAVNLNGSYNATNSTNLPLPGSGTANFNKGAKIVSLGNILNIEGGIINFNHGIPVTTPNVSINAGQLVTSSDITVTNVMTWSQGTIIGTSNSQINSLGNATIGPNANFRGGSFNNAGKVINRGALALATGEFNNLPGATFEVQQDNYPSLIGGGSAPFNNYGRFIKSTGTDKSTLLLLNNSGTVEVQVGSIYLIAGGYSTGSFSGSPNTVLKIGYDHTFAASSSIDFPDVAFELGNRVEVAGTFNSANTTSFTGAQVIFTTTAQITHLGIVTITVGTANFSSANPVTATQLTLSGPSRMSGTSNFYVLGPLYWTGGWMIGPGRTFANGGLFISGGAGKYLLGRLLENNQTALWSEGGIDADNGAIFRNSPGSTFNITGDVILFWCNFVTDYNTNSGSCQISGTRPIFENLGTLNKTGPGNAQFWGKANSYAKPDVVAFNSSGPVNLQGGTLGIANGRSNSTFSLATGTTLNLGGEQGATNNFSGDYTLEASSSVIGAGKVIFGSRGVYNINGTFNITDSLTLDGGTANFNPGANVISVGTQITATGGTANFSSGNPIQVDILICSSTFVPSFDPDNPFAGGLLSGSITGTSDITVTQAISWTGGIIGGSGKLFSKGTLSISGIYEKTLDGRTINNSGSAIMIDREYFTMNNGAIFNNTGSFESQGNEDQLFRGFGQISSFNNSGTFLRTGKISENFKTEFYPGVAFNNSGKVEVRNGVVNFSQKYLQLSGSTSLNGGVIGGISTPLEFQGGILSGTGTISGNLINGAEIIPGVAVGTPTTLKIDGNYTQLASGKLDLKLGGLTPGSQSDQFIVTGKASMDGTLNVGLINGYSPVQGDNFPVILYGSRNSGFATINGLDLGGGKRLQESYNPNDVTLQVQGGGGSTAGFVSLPVPGSTINLGGVLVGQLGTVNLIITSTQNITLTVDNPIISGSEASDFALLSTSFPINLNGSGVSQQITIRCAPNGVGVRSATLSLVTNDPNQRRPSYNLSCTGLVPGFSSNPAPESTFDFGSVPVGLAITSTITITETGNTTLTIFYGSQILGDNIADFTLITPGLPIDIPDGGQALTLQVRCQPTIIGPRSAVLLLATNDPYHPRVSYPLKCNGTNSAQALFNSSPDSGQILELGQTTVGMTVTSTLVISNTGSYTLTVSSPSLGGANPADFSIAPASTGLTLPPGTASQSVVVSCTPSVNGLRSASLAYTTNDPNHAMVNYVLHCAGTVGSKAGYNSIPAPGSIIVLGTTLVGTPITTTLTITETGSSNLTINNPVVSGDNASDFTLITPAFPLNIVDGGAAVPVIIQCVPKAPGTRVASLILTTNDPNQTTVNYSLQCFGTITSTSGYSSSPAPGTAIEVGSALVGTPITTTLTITETGSLTLTVSNPVVSGANAGDFTLVAPTFPLNIADGSAVTAVTIQCIPGVAGVRVASLTLNTNDPGQPKVTYSLSCTGITTNIVTSTTDDGSSTVPGTLSFALKNATISQTIQISLPVGQTTITLTGSLPALKDGVRLTGQCNAKGPIYTINGKNSSSTLRILQLQGNNWVSGLKFIGFEIKTVGRGNHFSCVAVIK